MPNWVHNTVHIAGMPEDVKAFLDKAAKPRPYIEDGETIMVEKDFSFWNFSAPPVDKWVEYFGEKGWDKNGAYGNTEYNWYNWNHNNWGCKWDAGEATIDYDGGNHAIVTFETPWDAPRQVIYKIAEEHKEVIITWEYLEEQGWGGEMVLDNGEISADEWDIPDSHEDYERRVGECLCKWAGDEFRFDDCPEQEEGK